MYYEVYIDIVFLTNLLMDYILLRIVGRLFQCRGNRRRCLLAAAMGALFSCLILYIQSDAGPIAAILLHGGCAVGMVRVGCGLKKGGLLIKGVITLYLAAFLCGGFWEAATVTSDGGCSPRTFLILLAGVCLALCAAAYLSDSFRVRMKHIYPITLSYQGKVQPAYGFYDTGNLLTDPVSGEPVSIVEPEILETMLSGELVDKLKHLQENPGELKSTELACLKPHYLTCRTVGQAGELLLAVTLEDLCIHTPREAVHVSRPVFALSFEPFALGNEYKVLLNSRLLD